jgi:hypothetical protein
MTTILLNIFGFENVSTSVEKMSRLSLYVFKTKLFPSTLKTLLPRYYNAGVVIVGKFGSRRIGFSLVR